MDAEKRVALELERKRQAAKCSVYATAIAEPVCRPHQESVEPFVPGRHEQSLKRRPVGETAFTAIEGVLSDTTCDTDHGGLNRCHVALELGPFASVEAVEGPAADESERPTPRVGAA
jgi:hypothetical protein